jgi:hypothetical protein
VKNRIVNDLEVQNKAPPLVLDADFHSNLIIKPNEAQNSVLKGPLHVDAQYIGTIALITIIFTGTFLLCMYMSKSNDGIISEQFLFQSRNSNVDKVFIRELSMNNTNFEPIHNVNESLLSLRPSSDNRIYQRRSLKSRSILSHFENILNLSKIPRQIQNSFSEKSKLSSLYVRIFLRDMKSSILSFITKNKTKVIIYLHILNLILAFVGGFNFAITSNLFKP